MTRRSSSELRAGLRGRAVDAGDGLLHIEGADGVTLCGVEVVSYPLHWATTSVIACGACLIAAGVSPAGSGPPGGAAGPRGGSGAA